MVNINNLSATLLLIQGSLFPLKRGATCFSPPENGSTTRIAPENFSSAFAEIDSLLRPDGTLELHFECALSLAAPFLLYRLKSYGFSGCRAVATGSGILLTARR
jgi:hypothetical protein